ncbi:hypothetical protein AMTR_s00129p00062010 [Amborella trichopoda]|uniref:Uncharacterized protein n=1 Tax=Amborella trichopoda TaxID=13333 RepID=W1NJQ1_AMBTC|nr:hypothetical protein AMTR_s00129p00062010 [Amborella trichopoda]
MGHSPRPVPRNPSSSVLASLRSKKVYVKHARATDLTGGRRTAGHVYWFRRRTLHKGPRRTETSCCPHFLSDSLCLCFFDAFISSIKQFPRNGEFLERCE